MNQRAIQDFFQRAEERKQRAMQGRFSEHSQVTYTPAALRALSNAPTITSTRASLQNTAGQLLKRPNDDGTMTAGTWGIDQWGRIVAI